MTDLRTLGWQARTDDSQNWRRLVFVAPEDGIAYVEELQQQQQQPAAAAKKAELSKADVQALIFGGEPTPGSPGGPR